MVRYKARDSGRGYAEEAEADGLIGAERVVILYIGGVVGDMVRRSENVEVHAEDGLWRG